MIQMLQKFFICLLVLSLTTATAQDQRGIIGKENWLMNWTNFKPKQTNYRDAKIILTGQINKNTILTKENTYLLVGDVFVTNNATLTIQAGTHIRGDFESNGTLIVTKNSKIIAEGTETDPIVFTSNQNDSRKAGDWGGIILLGDAPINKSEGVGCVDIAFKNGLCKYGGENENSDSGSLKYVRIEFSGKKFNKTRGLNALTLAAVGSKTNIEYVQISYANDDAIEVKGGNVNMKNIVTFKSVDDDFDLSMGTQLKINNSLIIRDPFLSEESKSRGFEVESFDKLDGSDSSRKLTTVLANNITMLNIEKDGLQSNSEAIYINDEANFAISNSVISGFEIGISLANKAATVANLNKKITLNNVLVNKCQKVVFAEASFNENQDFSQDIERSLTPTTCHLLKSNLAASTLFKNIEFTSLTDFQLTESAAKLFVSK